MAEPNRVGRPTKYDPAYCDLILEAAREGLSLTAFAGMVEVSRDTLNEWTRVHPEFSDAVKQHGPLRTLSLERGLLSSEVGPRVTARIFALKNAAPEEWKDKQENSISGAIQIESFTDEQRAKALANFIARTKTQNGE